MKTIEELLAKFERASNRKYYDDEQGWDNQKRRDIRNDYRTARHALYERLLLPVPKD